MLKTSPPLHNALSTALPIRSHYVSHDFLLGFFYLEDQGF